MGLSRRRASTRTASNACAALSWWDMEFAHEGTALIAEPGHQLLMYSAKPGAPSDDAYKLLVGRTAVWAT